MIAVHSQRSPAFRLASGEIHVWTIDLAPPPPHVDELASLLSQDERQRAEKFLFDRDRRRYVVARGEVRTLLGMYLGVPPETLRFVYGHHGKPRLDDVGGALSFNVSHAADLATLALSTDGSVGVDVEDTRRTVEFATLATRFFSPEEARELTSLADADRREAFFNCWTRKEAYVKALGDGLARPLDKFAVTLKPGERAAMRWIADDIAERWQLETFCPAEGFVGAVAYRGERRMFNVRNWLVPPASDLVSRKWARYGAN